MINFHSLSFFFSLICILFVHHVQTSFVETVYTSTLTPQQVQPNNGIEDLSYNGAVICVYLRYSSPAELDCEVQHNLGKNASGISIRLGERGTNGILIFRFDSNLANVRNVFQFNDTGDYTSEDLQSEFLNGNFYISINSQQYPGGIIRGQIEHKDRAYARLNAQNTIPSSSGTTATGIALGTYSFYSPRRLLSIDVIHNIVDPTELDLNEGLSNQIGDTLYSFSNSVSPVFDSVSLTIVENSNFFADLLYLNFKSESNPTGDIRGSLVTIDYPFTMSYTSELSGGGTESSGAALVSYNCESQLLEYLIIHNVPRASDAFIYFGDPNSDGVPLFTLVSGRSPIYGSLTLPSANLNALINKQLYFQIIKQSEQSQNIGGRITSSPNYWAYLSGTNELPAISTDNQGLALFTAKKANSKEYTISYQIYHSVTKPSSVDFRYASEGNVGPVLESLTQLSTTVNGKNTSMPLIGEFQISQNDFENYFNRSAIYLEITTKDYPLGLLRGQINLLDPCIVNESKESFPTDSYNVISYFDSFYPTLSIIVIASSDATILGSGIIAFILIILFSFI